MKPLTAWLQGQYRHAATAMLWSVSPVELVKTRPGFGQRIVAKRGAVVASPVLGAYDPDPDYFFHWYRDSALVLETLRLLFAEALATHDPAAPQMLQHFADFVHFNLALQSLDGRALVAAHAWRRAIAPDFAKFVRTDADLSGVHGEAVAGDTRVNADGTLDISSWPRPQNDGPALRALTLLRWSERAALAPELAAAVATLLKADLSYTRAHWGESCFDIWEEEHGLHYYTLSVCAAALAAGGQWLEERGALEEAHACRAEAHQARARLDGFWLADEGYYRSRILSSGARSTKELDIAVIMAALHGARDEPVHSVTDPRMHATLTRLMQYFDAAYPINRNRPTERAPAMGRYPGDVYYSGGAYYFSTLAAAEFCFRAAPRAADSAALIERGDAFLQTVRAFTPASGALSEQFDQRTGEQTSAKHLAWSYAAFISAVAARRLATAE